MDSRPVYETDKDRLKQKTVLNLLEFNWAVTMIDTPALACADAIAAKNFVAKALIEVKVRTNSWQDYPTYMISKHKVDDMIEVANRLKIKPILAVCWSDRVGWVEVRGNYPIDTGGRTDRSDEQDIETVYMIGMGEFRWLKPLPS